MPIGVYKISDLFKTKRMWYILLGVMLGVGLLIAAFVLKKTTASTTPTTDPPSAMETIASQLLKQEGKSDTSFAQRQSSALRSTTITAESTLQDLPALQLIDWFLNWLDRTPSVPNAEKTNIRSQTEARLKDPAVHPAVLKEFGLYLVRLVRCRDIYSKFVSEVLPKSSLVLKKNCTIEEIGPGDLPDNIANLMKCALVQEASRASPNMDNVAACFFMYVCLKAIISDVPIASVLQFDPDQKVYVFKGRFKGEIRALVKISNAPVPETILDSPINTEEFGKISKAVAQYWKSTFDTCTTCNL